MFNPLPLLALGAVAIGYSGAIDRVDQAFQSGDDLPVVAFTAAPNLSVQNFVGRLPETVQDPLCDTRDIVAASLSDDFAESRQSAWIQRQNVNMELWASNLMGTWTLLQVNTDGLTCIVASGFGWTEGMDAEDLAQERPLS